MTEKVASFGFSVDHPWKSLDTVRDTLKKLGAEGWELVSVMPQTNIHGATDSATLWLKRPAG
jgi:hypothetical protein